MSRLPPGPRARETAGQLLNLLLALSSGALLVLVFPRFGFTWLAPVAMAPLLAACAHEPSWKTRFVNGWLSGFVFWFFVCTWIQFVLEFHGGLGRWGGWATFILFAAIKGAYTGVFCTLAGILMNRSWAIPAVAALWTGFEYSHGSLGISWIGLGFAWLQLGNAAIDMPLLPRLAPWFGVYGLTFVLMMLNAAVALAALRRPRRELAPVLALVLLVLFPVIQRPEPGSVAVRVVQPNVDVDTRWTSDSFAQFEQRLAALSEEDPEARLVVWPEAPAPFYPDRGNFREFVSNVARSANAFFLFGAVAFTPDGAPLNSAYLLDPAGEQAGRYDKVELVPFGEYVPPAFGWVNRISGESGDFVPGQEVFDLPAGNSQLGVFICYESAFPNLVREFVHDGAGVLINLSNDGYFGDSAAREQHLALVRMRAIENQRWVLRATNNGITVMIDPSGRVTERMAEYQETADTMYFNYRAGQTLYTRFGDWFAWLCLAVGLISCGPRMGTGRMVRPARL